MRFVKIDVSHFGNEVAWIESGYGGLSRIGEWMLGANYSSLPLTHLAGGQPWAFAGVSREFAWVPPHTLESFD